MVTPARRPPTPGGPCRGPPYCAFWAQASPGLSLQWRFQSEPALPDGAFQAEEGLGQCERGRFSCQGPAPCQGSQAQWVVTQAMWPKRAGTTRAEIIEWTRIAETAWSKPNSCHRGGRQAVSPTATRASSWMPQSPASILLLLSPWVGNFPNTSVRFPLHPTPSAEGVV